MEFTDPLTGEVRPIETDSQAKDAYLYLKKVAKTVKIAQDIVKERLYEEIQRNGGPITYADGTVAKTMQRATKRSISRGDWLETVGGDEDKADLAMEVNVKKAEELLREWTEEGEEVNGKHFKDSIQSTFSKEYAVVEEKK